MPVLTKRCFPAFSQLAVSASNTIFVPVFPWVASPLSVSSQPGFPQKRLSPFHTFPFQIPLPTGVPHGSFSHPGCAIEAVFPFPVSRFRIQTRNKTQPCTKYESYSPGFPLQNETRRLMRRAFDISSLYLELLSILVPKMVSQGPRVSPLAFHTASQIPHPLNFRFVLPGGLCGSGNPREYRQLLQFPQQR